MVMRRITAALLIALGCLVFMGSVQVNRGSDVYCGGGAAYFEPEVITTILYTHGSYPNENIPEVAYDITHATDDGLSIRYGYIDSGAPDDVRGDDYYIFTRGTHWERGNTAEDGGSPNPMNGYVPFVWFSLKDIEAGLKINSAKIYLNRMPWANGATDLEGLGFFTARVDTVTSDYNCLGFASQTSDPCKLNITYNNMNDDPGGDTDPWDPPMSERQDGWQFGPCSDPIQRDHFVNVTGEAVVIDITKALQQHRDREDGLADLGVLITFGAVRQFNTHFGFVAGNSATYVGGNSGNPALVVETSTYRGTKPWYNAKYPVMLSYDDEHEIHEDYFASLGSGDPAQFDWVCYWDNWDPWCDTFYNANHENINFIYHSYRHDQLGSLTPLELNEALDKTTWLPDMETLPDTTNIDFAYPGGGGAPFYSLPAQWKLVGYNYRSARGTGRGLDLRYGAETPIGWPCRPSWFNHTNIYSLGSTNLSAVLLNEDVDPVSPHADADSIRTKLMIQVDAAVTDGGGAALYFYTHEYSNGSTAGNTATLKGLIDDAFFLDLRSVETVVEMMRGRGFVDVDEVVTATTAKMALSFADSLDNGRQAFSSARQDSCANAEGGSIHDLFNRMWVGPGEGD